MTIRGYIALFYGVAAIGVSVLADTVPALNLGATPSVMVIMQDHSQITLHEMEPDLMGNPEGDDLPAYLSEDEADFAKGRDRSPELAVRRDL